jgi:tetratricopeptide (TPR) repeat protein
VPATGKITALSPSKVTIAVRGNEQNYDMSDVLKISFDGEPTELERARDQCLNDQYDQALDEIKKLDPSSIENPVLQQEVQFYRWYCEGKLGLEGQGDKEAAIRGLIGIVAKNRNTHHFYDIGELLGELNLALGKPNDAAKYFGVLLNAPDADTKARGVYRLAQVQLYQDEYEAARERFSQLMNAPAASEAMTKLKSLAEVGLAVCDQKAGKNEEALRKLDELIAKYPSTEYDLFAQIYNAKGAIHEQLGQPVQALLSYLKTDLLFFTEAEAHAEALYHLKSLWTEYGDPARAADAGKRLVAQYASSKWANQP